MASTTRSIALMIILIRGGLNLDPNQIRRLSLVVARVAFVPCIIEALTVAGGAYLLFHFSASWSLMLGFVIAAVSPAVVIPSLIKIATNDKFDHSKGIPSLIIAAASIDDILAIAGFSICLGFSFATFDYDNTKDVILSAIKAPMEAVIGVVFGILAGAICWYIPETCDKGKDSHSDKYHLHRFTLLLLLGLFCQFGSTKFNITGAGPMASLVVAFVASLRWRNRGFHLFCETGFKQLWIVFQHFLFALIASDVRISVIQPNVLLYGFITLIIGLVARILTVYLVLYGNGFTRKERLFVAISWLPKATVQAAIGPIALDNARNDREHHDGHIILTVAVLAILITAPIGAILIESLSNILLEKANPQEPTVDNLEQTQDWEMIAREGRFITEDEEQLESSINGIA